MLIPFSFSLERTPPLGAKVGYYGGIIRATSAGAFHDGCGCGYGDISEHVSWHSRSLQGHKFQLLHGFSESVVSSVLPMPCYTFLCSSTQLACCFSKLLINDIIKDALWLASQLI
ncbi:hypothetical protein J1N35_037391 [Gossypium stocksii]|uniref:Uncharacterized protein n=1 Tax=Gossypium stocksii TaxID=47602 RepID=A0A9D3ZLQ8_9ROSI|nr:hypothetical protein J1N35_037391 [Gossypium stocksii]